MNADPGADETLALARRLSAPGDGAAAVAAVAAAGLTPALAWALKDVCYAAWGGEPARSARAADVLQALVASAAPAAAGEIAGLAAWTAGIACLTRGAMADAVRAFDAAAAALRGAGLPDPAAQTQVPKIMALSMLGEHAQAAACAEAAQRELLALGNVRAAARVSQNLGSLQIRRDRYAEAARHFRAAAVLFARQGEDANSVLADVGLAGALTGSGDFDEADRIHARARMRAGQRGLELPLAQLDESEALLDLARGRYRQALAGLESARRRYESLGLPQYLAIAEKQLADAYLELRLLPEAKSLFDAAVARFAELDLPDEQAWALAQRGRAETFLGQPGADASFAAAAALFAAGGNSVGTAAVAVARAELALGGGGAAAAGPGHASAADDAGRATGAAAAGARAVDSAPDNAAAEVALAFARQAAAGFKAAGQADGLAQAEVVRGRALLAAGRVDEARQVFAATWAAACELQQTQIQVRCLSGLGLAARAAGDPGAAAAHFEAAIELFEDQRRALPDDQIRSAFLTDHLRPYQELLRLALDDGDAAEVLQQAERFRARALDEKIAEGPAAAADAAALQPLRERLNWLYRRVQRLHEEGAPTSALDDELVRGEGELLERARRQRLGAPAGAAAAAEFSVATLQRALQTGDAVVEYGRLDDELFACVVTRDGVRLLRRLATWPEVVDAVRAVRFQIDTLRHGAAPVQQHLAVLAERLRLRLVRLHALIWAPLAAAVGAAQRVLVVPHAQLGGLPFAALGDGTLCLGERHALALAPSARAALRGLLQPPRPPRRVLALGESSRLPHAAHEAEVVAALFAAGAAHVGVAATLACLRAGAATADVVHLACHAEFRSDNPRFSALRLADAALTALEAEALPLPASTVVLSACETGLAEHGAGDEMVGLVRAFLVAGAARVVASLWPVDDAITLEFMTHLHRALAAGQAPAAALQRAQALTRAVHPHPYFWAAFTLYGGW